MITEILNIKYEIESMSAKQNGTNKVTFTATGTNGNGTQAVQLIVAQYKDGKLVDVKSANGTFSKTAKTVDVEYTPVDGATAKAFAWDSLSGMNPIMTDTTIAAE